MSTKRWATATLALWACVVLAACSLQGHALGVSNQTDQGINVSYLSDGQEQATGYAIEPGFTGYSNPPVVDDCYIAPLIARATDTGELIARRDEPVCIGETWTVSEE